MFGDSWIKKIKSWRDEGHVSRYPIIPDNVTPWPNRGVQFVDANAFLAWGEPEGAVVQKLLDSGMMKNLCTEGTAYSDIRILFMGHRVQIILNYFPEFEDPHVENTLAVCHLV